MTIRHIACQQYRAALALSHRTGSPIEGTFGTRLAELLTPHVKLHSQFEVPTAWATFLLDFAFEDGDGHMVGIECDGREYHLDTVRDEMRDALILGTRQVNVVYRITGAAIWRDLETVLRRLHESHPLAFDPVQTQRVLYEGCPQPDPAHLPRCPLDYVGRQRMAWLPREDPNDFASDDDDLDHMHAMVDAFEQRRNMFSRWASPPADQDIRMSVRPGENRFGLSPWGRDYRDFARQADHGLHFTQLVSEYKAHLNLGAALGV